MEHRILTINRMYGSGGRLLGKALSERLGIHFYDKELIQLASEDNQIPYEELVKVDEKKASQWRLPIKEQMQMQPQYHFHPMNDVLFETQSKIIQDLAKRKTASLSEDAPTKSWKISVSASLSTRLLNTGYRPLCRGWEEKKKRQKPGEENG